jgi:RNA polymerase sigma-70 factor (ECF subfamily)
LTDGQLLERFRTRQDEAAFEALVHRHGPVVLGVCRRVLHNPHDAEDAFQATFLVLVRRAGSIGKQESVGSWLYGVAYRTALKAKVHAAIRRRHEQQAGDMPRAVSVADQSWQDLCPVLDAEVNRLPEKYRAPIVLCYLEGKSKEEAARELGWPTGTVSGRLARARDLLRSRLARRGVALSAGLLVLVLSQNAATAAVPASLVGSTVHAATLFAPGKAVAAGIASTKAALLAKSVLLTFLLARLKLATALVLTTSLLATSAGFLVYRVRAAEHHLPRRQAQAPAALAAVKKVQGPETKNARSQGDKEKLQGTWMPVAGKRGGAETRGSEELVLTSALAFEGDQYLMRTRDAITEGSFRLDPARKPRAIDLSIQGTNQRVAAIYEFDGEYLKLCLGSHGDERPTEFKTSSRCTFLLLQRAPGDWCP